MTTATIATGWVLTIGGTLILLGALTLAILRSRWAESQAQRAESIVGETPAETQQRLAAAPFAHELDCGMGDYLVAKAAADALARIELAVFAEVLAQPDTLLWVPAQRQPYDHEKEGL